MLVYTLSKIDPRPAAPCIHPPANPPEGKREMRGQDSGPRVIARRARESASGREGQGWCWKNVRTWSYNVARIKLVSFGEYFWRAARSAA